jgi:predicted Zn-dependent protease
MQNPRRGILIALAGATGLLFVDPLLSTLLAQGRTRPQPMPYPNGRDPNDTGLEQRSTLDQQAAQRANQIELRKNVSKLYEMASELKAQFDKADASATLSLSVVKKAEQIEKLAKQIKGLAKG